MSSFKIGKYIRRIFEVQEIVEESAFGELYLTTDVKNSNQIKKALIFSIDDSSIDKSRFDKFAGKLETYRTVLLSENPRCAPESVSSWQDPDRRKKFILCVYPGESFGQSLGKEIGWDETLAKVEKLKAPKECVELVIALSKTVMKFHAKDLFFSYISPDTLHVFDNKYYPILPGFHLLLKAQNLNKERDIRAITSGNHDVQAFFLAPELIRTTNAPDNRSDVWSLGLLFALMLKGKLPFQIENESDYISAVHNSRLSFDFEGIPEQLRTIIHGCLQLDPLMRFDLQSFINALSACEDTFLHETVGLSEPEESEFSSSWIDVGLKHSVTLKNPAEKQVFSIKIDPNRIPDTIGLIENGRTISILAKCLQSANRTSERHLQIPIYPKPQIELVREQSQLIMLPEMEFNPSVLSGGLETRRFKAEIVFRVRRSSIAIAYINPTLDTSEVDGHFKTYDTKFSLLNQLIGPSAATERILFEFEFDASPMILRKNVTVQLVFSLRGHSEITESVILRPYQPVSLLPNFDLINSLKVFTLGRQVFPIEFKVLGSNNVRPLAVSISPVHPNLQATLDRFSDTWFEPGDSFTINLTADASSVSNQQITQGAIIIEFNERSAESLHTAELKKLEFRYNLNIENPDEGVMLSVDFGTTNTCAATHFADGRILVHHWQTLSDQDSDSASIPSYIYYSQDDINQAYIGQPAKAAFRKMERNAFHSIKRFLGMNRTPVVRQGNNLHPISYAKMTNDFLLEMFNVIRNETKHNFKEFVFTHPTDLAITKRKEFERIVEGLGLTESRERIRYIDEATAGVLNYVRENADVEKYFLVYDFGGGTTDVVFAKFTNTVQAGGLFGTQQHKKLEKVFTAGYDFGGDDINSIIIESIRATAFAKSGEIIPYIPPVSMANVPGYYRENVELARLQNNATRLWEISEQIKLNCSSGSISELIANFGSSNQTVFGSSDSESFTFDRIHCCSGTSYKNPENWNWEVKENLASIKIDSESYREILKQTFCEVGKELSTRIIRILSYLQKTKYTNNSITILLLGRSSKFPLVRHLFEYYFQQIHFPCENYFGFVPPPCPIRYSQNCEIVLPHELKHVVALGALELAKNINAIELVEDSVQYNITDANGTVFIHTGSSKIRREDEIWQCLDQDKHDKAVFFSETFSFVPPSGIKVVLQETRVNDVTERGIITIPAGSIDSMKKVRSCIYIDVTDKLHWFLFDEARDIEIQGEF